MLGEFFSVWEGAPSVVEGTDFVYCDASLDPNGEATECYWGDAETFEKIDFSIAAGQAVVIECAEGMTVTASGQVPIGDVTFTTAAQNNFSCNPFPATIDIQAIKIEGEGVGMLGEFFSVWEGAPTVVEGSDYVYCDASLDPNGEAKECYWGDAETFEKVNYAIPAGQGFVIESAADLTITIAAPYTL